MATTETVRVLSVSQPSVSRGRSADYFYFCMSLLIAATVIYGFSHTVDRNLVHANPRRPLLLWVHGILFSVWVGFYILQSALVRARNVRLHRTVGWAGAALGLSMIVVGFWVAVVMARFDVSQLHRVDRDAFLAIPFLDMVSFATCLGLAILWRKQPERHRRLMLIACCALTAAAFGRLAIMHSIAPLYFYSGVDGLILLGVFRDLAVSRRIHTVYLTAIPLLIAGQAAALYLFMHKPAFWMRITHSLVS
jgi:hypothetical protein